jgi:cytochrome oxidase Cu insertion factor (SCO1/SenC/PrrC family)
MKTPWIAAVSISIFITSASGFAQLGPKDGPNSPATEIDRVKVGRPAPDFSLEDVDGRTVTLSDFRGKKSVVLTFYRGYW